jgi:release factor glutamine methyltransferase
MGRTRFFGLDLIVNEDALIPRPETEILVQSAIDLSYATARNYPQAPAMRILDLCTGSGNIAIALARAIPGAKITASDISVRALGVARRNAELNGLGDRIEFIESDLFDGLRERFDIIVSNPPYIARYEFATLQKEVLKEPRIALDGGDDGLDYYRRIFSQAPRHLVRGGRVIVEIGYGQETFIKEIIKNTGAFRCLDVIKDQNGIDRVMVTQWIN